MKLALTPIVVIGVVCLLVGGCEQAANGSAVLAAIATSNSYLGSAVREFVGDDVPLMHLAEPGMCPGHFDLRPSQLQAMRGAKLLFRFDFQKSLDAKLGRLCDGGLRIVEVTPPGALCETASYMETCRQVASALVESRMVDESVVKQRLASIEQRMNEQSVWAEGVFGQSRHEEFTGVGESSSGGFL